MEMDRKSYEIDLTSAIRYAGDGETALLGDLYRPVDRGPHPVIVAVHGDGWDQGSRSSYGDWGTYLAERGFALFATDRRHFQLHEPAFPGVIEDFQAAVRYVRSHAAELNIDPQRIATMGDSSGGYIAALAGLVGDTAMGQKAEGESQATSCAVKAVIAVYGVFDLAAEWNFEQVARPFDRVTEKLLGVPLVDDRKRYFDASPVAYVTRNRNHIAFFLAWGTADDVVSEELQSRPFAQMLGQANFTVHTMILPHAQHYWASDPLHGEASHASLLAPRLVRFLEQCL
jgi:acetyl esterase/lipase